MTQPKRPTDPPPDEDEPLIEGDEREALDAGPGAAADLPVGGPLSSIAPVGEDESGEPLADEDPAAATALATGGAAGAGSAGTSGRGGRLTSAVPTDELPYVDDRVSKAFVLAMVGVFAGIFAYAVLFGGAGALTPDRTPRPSPDPSPSVSPVGSPSVSPSGSPSESPSADPSGSPSASPSESPSASPSESPSVGASPSGSPSVSPSVSPPASFSGGPSPGDSPSASPAGSPSASPSPEGS